MAILRGWRNLLECDFPRKQTKWATFAHLWLSPYYISKNWKGVIVCEYGSTRAPASWSFPDSSPGTFGAAWTLTFLLLPNEGLSSTVGVGSWDAQSFPPLWFGIFQPSKGSAKGGTLKVVGRTKPDFVSPPQCIFQPKFAKYIGSCFTLRAWAISMPSRHLLTLAVKSYHIKSPSSFEVITCWWETDIPKHRPAWFGFVCK